MVKGVARHAVIVRPTDMREFEQAIFIVSGESSEPQVRSPGEMLTLATRLAERYQVSGKRPRRPARARLWPCVMSFLAGAVATAAAFWLALTYLPL